MTANQSQLEHDLIEGLHHKIESMLAIKNQQSGFFDAIKNLGDFIFDSWSFKKQKHYTEHNTSEAGFSFFINKACSHLDNTTLFDDMPDSTFKYLDISTSLFDALISQQEGKPHQIEFSYQHYGSKIPLFKITKDQDTIHFDIDGTLIKDEKNREEMRQLLFAQALFVQINVEQVLDNVAEKDPAFKAKLDQKNLYSDHPELTKNQQLYMSKTVQRIKENVEAIRKNNHQLHGSLKNEVNKSV